MVSQNPMFVIKHLNSKISSEIPLNFGPALARSRAKGAGSHLGGPALYP